MELLNFARRQWDRVAAWACILLGAIALVAGWVGVSTTAYPAEQIPYVLSGGLGGIFLLGVGALLWLSADLRDEWRKLDRIEREMASVGLSQQDGGLNGQGLLEPPGPSGSAEPQAERGKRRARTGTQQLRSSKPRLHQND